MKIAFKTLLGVFCGFLAGIITSNVPHALAGPAAVSIEELSNKSFDVSVFEIKQKLVPGDFFSDKFSGSYIRKFTLSDGTQRQVELTPMMHNGMQVVQLKDNGGTTYMGLNGTTLNGTLLIDLRDRATAKAQLKSEGLPVQ